jgi:hypothetical protein
MRYSKDMFSFPSPEFIAMSSAHPSSSLHSSDKVANEVLDQKFASKAALEKLKSSIQTPLAPMGEPSGKSIGFFEQGLFTGLAVEAVVAAGFLAICARYAVPAILKRV